MDLRAQLSKEVSRRAQAESQSSGYKFDYEHQLEINKELRTEIDILKSSQVSKKPFHTSFFFVGEGWC